MEVRFNLHKSLAIASQLFILLVIISIGRIVSFDIKERRLPGKALFFYIEKPRQLAYTYEVRSSEEIGVPFPEKPQNNLALQYAFPANGCTDMQPIHGDAVLIERGDCSFTTKALMASRAGARIAIITDSAAGTDEWIDMIDDGSARKSDIPVAYLPGVSGRRIREHLLYGDEHITITIPLNYSSLLLNEIPRKPPWELW